MPKYPLSSSIDSAFSTSHLVFGGLLLASLLVVTGCVNTTSPATSPSLEQVLATADRTEQEKARDSARKPAQVIEFLGIKSGDKVLDVIAAGGYYTEVLAHAVGPTGLVYAQNPAVVLAMRDGANDKAMSARLASNRLPNVIRWDREFPDLGLQPGSLDAAVTALNLHDVYNRDPQAAIGMLGAINGLLKSGGILGIIDHNSVTGADHSKLHRMLKSQAIDAATAAGFKVAGDSELLAVPQDDHSKFVFAQGVRGNTDRFLLKLVKP